MNPELLFELATMSIDLARELTDDYGDYENIEQKLLALIHLGVNAYEEHTGMPFNTDLIQAEASL